MDYEERLRCPRTQGDWWVAEVLLARGRLLQQRGDAAGAQADFEEALARSEARATWDITARWLVPEILVAQGCLAASQGRYDAAEVLLCEAQAGLAPRGTLQSAVMMFRAWVAALRGLHDQARELARTLQGARVGPASLLAEELLGQMDTHEL